MKFAPVDIRSDRELLKLAQAGDRNAFGQLISNHYQSCVNIATSILRNRTEAEDNVQQAAWKAFNHLDQYLGEAEFFAWLIRIVVNECRMVLRDRKRARFQPIGGSQQGADDRQPELLSQTADPECQSLKTEMIHVLKMEIQHIPPMFRVVILLRDVNELPMLEVADRLGITVSAAKSRLLRARNELRRRVTSRLGPARHMLPLSTEQTLPARRVSPRQVV
jgi:RNA polymerase sigma-70 factor, ECF subfamily